MEEKRVRGAAVITFISVLYFIWLMIVVLQDQGYILSGTDMPLSLQWWAIIGIILFAVFFLAELYLYLTAPRREPRSEGIKLVSAVTTKVMCSDCHTVFTISDTGTRPLKYTCPNCGQSGALRKQMAAGVRKNVQCERCENVFEIHDTGERPLKYTCPECHHVNALSA